MERADWVEPDRLVYSSVSVYVDSGGDKEGDQLLAMVGVHAGVYDSAGLCGIVYHVSNCMQNLIVFGIVLAAAVFWSVRIFRNNLALPLSEWLLKKGRVGWAFQVRKCSTKKGCH